jgi:hypothetical protein
MFSFIIRLFSCQSQPKENEIKDLLLDLKKQDTVIRFKAIEKLENINITEQQSLRLIDAATEKYPPAKYGWETIPGLLITAAAKKPSLKFVSPVKNNFDKLDADAKEKALIFLAGFDNPQSIQAYIDIVTKHKNEINTLPTGKLSGNYRYNDIIFPRIMELLDNEKLAPEVLLLLLDRLESKTVNAEQFTNYLPRIYALDSILLQMILKKQTSFTAMNTMWDDEEYLEWRREAGIILDLLGYLKHSDIIKELKKYLPQKDNKLKMFAAVSLIMQGEKVNVQTLEEIAADPESRNWLYDKLVAINKSEYFPAQYRTQEAFAQAEIVNWLLYPTELGRNPEKIELMKIVKVDTEEDGEVEFYIYRFKSDHPDWKDSGWMAGVAGYYKVNDKPTTIANGYTFSSFEKWEGKTAEEHLGDISNIIKKANRTQK